jgi:hypothetical protein
MDKKLDEIVTIVPVGKTEDEMVLSVIQQLADFGEYHEPRANAENDGIGAYEHFGFRGYDRGNDWVTLDNPDYHFMVDTTKVSDIDSFIIGVEEGLIGHDDPRVYKGYVDAFEGGELNYTAYFKVEKSEVLDPKQLKLTCNWKLLDY